MNKTFYKLLFIFIFIIMLLIPSSYAASTPDFSLNSTASYLLDASSGQTLYERNGNEKLYPASLTKVLTAIVVVENSKLDEIATVSETAINSVEDGYLTSNLKPNEQVTVEQLLNILILSSANDVAVVLAEHVSGSVENFATLMNQTALKIGCTNSNFVNPNGTHNENHYSTAHDLCLIGNYALKFDDLKEIWGKTFFTLPTTNIYTQGDRTYNTTNEILLSWNSNYYKYAKGMKTGFTTPAGYCLMCYAKKNDLELVSVVLNSSTSENRYLETKMLLDYGFDNFSLKKFANKGEIIQTVPVKGATNKTKKLNLVLDNDLFITVDNDLDLSTVKSETKINKKLKAPIASQTVVGSLSYTLNGITYTQNLLAETDVKSSHLVLKFVIFFIIVFILLIVLKLRKMKLKNKRINMIKRF